MLGYSCYCVTAILILSQNHIPAYAETLEANKKTVRHRDISRQAAGAPRAPLQQGEKFNARCDYAYRQQRDSVNRAQSRNKCGSTGNATDLRAPASENFVGARTLNNESTEQLEADCKPALPGDSSDKDHSLLRSQNYNYRGNIESRKFHELNCVFATVMAKSRRIAFQSQQQAIEAGMSPCNWCLPPYWTSVRGKILLEKNLPWGLVP